MNEPQDHGPATDAPDDGRETDAPDDGAATDAPDGRGTDAPDDSPATGDEPGADSARSGVAEQTRDDTDAGWGEAPDPRRRLSEHEQWLLDQRPPHWD